MSAFLQNQCYTTLYCVICSGEVIPERIGFDAKLADEIASWRSVHQGLYCLWLDSGEYEEWAKQQLTNAGGQVNLRGRELALQLNATVTTYYWWFHDMDNGLVENCPICNDKLSESDDLNFQRCEKCFIML